MTSVGQASQPVKTRRADPKHGDLGVLVDQSRHILFLERGEYAIDEVVEIYLSEISWEETRDQPQFTNLTTNNVTIEKTRTNVITIAKGTERATSLGFSAKVKDIGFDVGTGRKTFTGYTQKTERTSSEIDTVEPGQTLYRYQLVYKFNIRTWWIADFSNIMRIVTVPSNYTDTRYAVVQAAVLDGVQSSVAPLTGVEYLDTKPVNKSISDLAQDAQLKRSKLTDLPDYLQGWVNGAHARASSGSETDIKAALAASPIRTWDSMPPMWKST